MIRFAFVVLLLLATSARACLWDYDTLNDERRGLPGIAEIIAGQWERHGEAFYRHRIAAMQKSLAEQSDDWTAWDNLSVAHEKVGEIDQAIRVSLDKEARSPGQYTTAANLGTFYLHQGDLARGMEHIRRALHINPDAHFGREKYQLQVAEYLKDPPPADADGACGSFVVPMLEMTSATTRPAPATVEQRMTLARRGRPTAERRAEIDKAIQGVVGMIRFGTGVSPHLYYALGDLLSARGDTHLAHRAYLRAIELNHPNPKEVRAAAVAAAARLEHPGDLKADFAAARRDADAWVAAYQQHEQSLLAAGRDPENVGNYAAFYAAYGSPREPLGRDWPKLTRERLIVLVIAVPLSAYVIIRVILSLRKRRPVPE